MTRQLIAAKVAALLEELREPNGNYETAREPITTPEQVIRTFRGLLDGLRRETFAVVFVDAKLRPIGEPLTFSGEVSHVVFSPRAVFRAALERDASGIFMAHNHPSGDPTPSDEDRSVARSLAVAGRTLSCNLIDWAVLGSGRAFVDSAGEVSDPIEVTP